MCREARPHGENRIEKPRGDDSVADGSPRDRATGRSRARVETHPADLGRGSPETDRQLAGFPLCREAAPFTARRMSPNKRLYDEGVATVYVGDLSDVLETHWSVRVNEKTHNFWPVEKFIHRLACVCEEYSTFLEAESEAWTSQTCPECSDHKETVRHGDTLTCPCGFEGHADLAASETSLRNHSETEGRPMARPVRFEWDTHNWSRKPPPHENPKKCAQTRKLPPWVGSRTPNGGLLAL
jgi:hypothetical protein